MKSEIILIRLVTFLSFPKGAINSEQESILAIIRLGFSRLKVLKQAVNGF